MEWCFGQSNLIDWTRLNYSAKVIEFFLLPNYSLGF